VAGGQIKTFVLSHVIKINKELQTSMTHSPARLPQAFVFIFIGAVNIPLIKASLALPGVIYYKISTEYLQYLFI
jgi:hypothetical protein